MRHGDGSWLEILLVVHLLLSTTTSKLPTGGFIRPSMGSCFSSHGVRERSNSHVSSSQHMGSSPPNNGAC